MSRNHLPQPHCGTSRGALSIIRETRHRAHHHRISQDAADERSAQGAGRAMGVPVKDVVRWKQKDEVAEAGISENSSDEALLEAMAKFPILMNRPIVVTDKGVKLCRPGDAVSGLL